MLDIKKMCATCLCIVGTAIVISAVAADVVVTPTENPAALRNPLTGFRGLASSDGLKGMGPYPTLTEDRDRLNWPYMENVESDGIDKIRAYLDQIWADYPANNVKSVFRVMLTCPGCGPYNGFPSDIEGSWDPKFWPRLMRFVERLGIVLDNDPRVGYIESGFAGNWGEGWFEGQQAIDFQAAMTRAFKNKLIMKREAWVYEPGSWGMYWDSFAHPDQTSSRIPGWMALTDSVGNPRWQTSVMGGEVAYDWGDYARVLGATPTVNMSTPAYYNRVINCIRQVHSNHLGWISRYDSTDPATTVGAALMQKALGYNYVMDTLTYPSTVQVGQPFAVSFAVRNTGSSPMYYRWPVQVSLLNKSTHAPVWSGIFDATDIRKWQPGSNWSLPYSPTDADYTILTGRSYQTPASRYHETGTFTIPSSVPNGEYVLALAVLDGDGGMLPSLRFAINNYWTGGYHPMGIIGVGAAPSSTAIDPSTFFIGISDTTLHYIMPAADNTPPSTPSGLSGQGTSQSTISLSWNPSTDPESGVREYNVYRGGVKIATTVGTSYNDQGLSTATSFVYQVASVNGRFLESAKATAITVSTMDDITPPSISNVSAVVETQVQVAFSEPVEQASAQNAGNYAMSNGITVSAANLGSDLTTVTLTVSTMTILTNYTLTVNNIRDRAAIPNTIAVNTTAQFQFTDLITKIRYYPRSGMGNRMQGGIFEGTNGNKDNGPYTTLYTIGSGPGDQWTDVTSFTNPDIGYRFIRYRQSGGGSCNVAEIEFYRGALNKAAGTPFGTPGSWNNSGNDFTKAFDGNTSTFFDAPIDAGAYLGLDLQAGATGIGGRLPVAGMSTRAIRMLPHSMIALPPEGFSLLVVNVTGAVVLRTTGMGPRTFDLSSMGTGIHIATLTSGGTTVSKTFITAR